MAKKNDYVRIEEIGDAFRHAGQNPSADTVKDMIDKATKLKASYHREDDDEGLSKHRRKEKERSVHLLGIY